MESRFDVRDAHGVEWSVKLGPEAQSAVVTSRILWALGFHPPPTYYLGIYRDVINSVRPADVRWTCERLGALSDRQWNDALRARGFTSEHTARYVKKIRSKIDQGLALTAG